MSNTSDEENITPQTIRNNGDERWESLIFMKCSNYHVSTHGRVSNIKRKSIVNANIAPNGCTRIHLRDDTKKGLNVFVSQLVADAFIPKDDEKPFVIRIDKDPSNDHVDNLKRCSRSEIESRKSRSHSRTGRAVYQLEPKTLEVIKRWEKVKQAAKSLNLNKGNISTCCKYIDTTCGGYKWRYCDVMDEVPGEIWRDVPFPEYISLKASSLGRIKYVKSGRVTFGTKNPAGYMQFSAKLVSSNLSSSIGAHILIAAAFHGRNDELEVNHKNGIKNDNNPENLEYMTCSQNVKHSYDTGLRVGKGACRVVIQYDLEKKEIARHISLQDAHEKTGISRGNISSVCNKKRHTAGGFIWVYEDNPDNQ